MSQLKVDSIIPRTGVATGQGGGVVQVITKSFNALVSTTLTSYAEVSSSFRATIVPKSGNNKIIIIVNFGNVSAIANTTSFRIYKNGTTFVNEPNSTTSNKHGNAAVYAAEYMNPTTIIVSEKAVNTDERYYSPFYRINSDEQSGDGESTGIATINRYRLANPGPTYVWQTTSHITLVEVSGEE